MTSRVSNRQHSVLARATLVVLLLQGALLLADFVGNTERAQAVPGVMMATVAILLVNRKLAGDDFQRDNNRWIFASRAGAVGILAAVTILLVLDRFARAPTVDPRFALLLLWGLIALKGAAVGKLRPGGPLGLRVPWTLRSDLAWERAHRVLGRGLFFGSLVGILASPFVPWRLSATALAALIVTALATAVYESWRTCRCESA